MFILSFITIVTFLLISKTAFASDSTLYVPLIGLTSVPDPLVLPQGGGNITYNYAVKNFLREITLTEVQVVDDKCGPVKFVEGDDNGDSKLDTSETWTYTCRANITQTTTNTATASGWANGLIARDFAFVTVVVAPVAVLVVPGLPNTGIVPGGNNFLWYIIILVSIITFTSLAAVLRKNKF